MIEINLLPEDLKRHARVRGGGQRRTVLCVTLLVVAAAGAGYFHVVHVRSRKARNGNLAAALADLQKETEELASLQAAVKHIEKRQRTLADLYRQRVLWAEKLDQLVDIIPENVWVRSIRLATARHRVGGQSAGGTLTLECYSAGAEEKGITLFRHRLKGHEAFWQDVEKINPIQHRWREFPAYVEKEALDFTVDLKLKGRTPAQPAVPARPTRTVSTGP